jgi:hypothetical protein
MRRGARFFYAEALKLLGFLLTGGVAVFLIAGTFDWLKNGNTRLLHALWLVPAMLLPLSIILFVGWIFLWAWERWRDNN